MAKIKTINTNTTTIIDGETGEVLNNCIKKIKVVTDTDDFALIYVGFWNALIGNTLIKADIELLAYILKNFSDGRLFSITKVMKEEICKETGKNITTYNNCTRVLVHNNFIIKKGTRTYVVNPEYAFKGSSKNRNKAVIELSNF